MGSLTFEGRIVQFKLDKIQKSFLWRKSSPKVKHKTTCKDYNDCGLKRVDKSYKIVRLNALWWGDCMMTIFKNGN